MSTQQSYMLFYEIDPDKLEGQNVKFDLDRFPLSFCPQLIKALQSRIFFESSKIGFNKERAQFADNIGIATEDFISQQLRLKL